jgi:hypothetical protein
MTTTSATTPLPNTNASQAGEDTPLSKSRATMYRKEVKYDRVTRDYACYLDGELMGFERNYHAGEVYLDRLVFDLLSGGAFRDAA